jgi:hypothetical protein
VAGQLLPPFLEARKSSERAMIAVIQEALELTSSLVVEFRVDPQRRTAV